MLSVNPGIRIAVFSLFSPHSIYIASPTGNTQLTAGECYKLLQNTSVWTESTYVYPVSVEFLRQ